MPFWPFRSTRDHIARMRRERAAVPAQIELPQPLPCEVLANHSSGTVSVRWEQWALTGFDLKPRLALEFAAQIEQAARSLMAKDESVDITADVDGKEPSE